MRIKLIYIHNCQNLISSLIFSYKNNEFCPKLLEELKNLMIKLLLALRIKIIII